MAFFYEDYFGFHRIFLLAELVLSNITQCVVGKMRQSCYAGSETTTNSLQISFRSGCLESFAAGTYIATAAGD